MKRLIDLAQYYYECAVAYRKAGYLDLAVENWRISKECRAAALTK